jgi:hypothetical protein
MCQQKADLSVQFVDGAIAFKAGTGLIDALPADKRCCTGIAGPGINLTHFIFKFLEVKGVKRS